MARDFASKPPPAPERSRVPGWVWVFTTLASVAFVGFLYYLSQIPAEEGGAQAVRDTVKQSLPESVKTLPDKPAAKAEPTDKDSKAPSLEQAFEFYRLLKDDEVPVTLPKLPKPNARDQGVPSDSPVLPSAGAKWMIQVASFSKVGDADRLRAELIINGLTETHLSTVELGDRGTYHRVMVGPFDNRSRLNKAQDILVGLNHEVIVRTLN